MPQSGYETFDHGADIGIRGFGLSLQEAFVQAAKGMFALMVEDLEGVPAEDEVSIKVTSFDLESLLVVWLNTLLSEADLNGLILSKFEVEIKDLSLQAKAWGAPYRTGDNNQGIEVKGATLSEVAVYESKGIWIAQCVIDV